MRTGRHLSTIALITATSLVALVASCKSGNEDGKTEARQGWSSEQRLGWYQGTQGSRMMPWSWAQALEQKDNDQPFLAAAHLARYRVLPLPESPDGLPVGFARDKQPDDGLSFSRLRWFSGQGNEEEWLGLNCSACHTGEVSYKGVAERIDGGPSLFDFQSFSEAADAAFVATRDDPAKWDRFAAKVLNGRDTPANRAMLKAAFGQLTEWQQKLAHMNETPIRYGYARLDAIGDTFNKLALLAVNQMPAPSARPTPNAPDAPVSYPFLWNIYRHDKLQHNGIVEASRKKIGDSYLDVGAIGRNTGEVIAVFGDVVVPTQASGTLGYPSSVQVHNLDRLEAVLRHLTPPKWPDRFGVPKPELVAAGKALYDKNCLSCHTMNPPGDGIFAIHMEPLKRDAAGAPNHENTDPWMACNAISYTSATGNMAGRKAKYFAGPELQRTEPLATVLASMVVGVLAAEWREMADAALDVFLGVEKPPKVVGARDVVSDDQRRAQRLDQCYKSNSPLFAYKARPLDGIWATPPYLHNGSVPTLYDLLLPPDQRPASFNVGTREYDPVKVGYVTTADAPGNEFPFTARGHANSNEGHDYGVGALKPEERAALLEYLKTL
jgi:hypothetical protein